MTKSTATYWNTFAPENKQKWSPIAGLEGTVEELTLSIVQNTGEYNYIPALNENDAWIQAMTQIVLENLQGWVSAEWDVETAKKSSDTTKNLAKNLGA